MPDVHTPSVFSGRYLSITSYKRDGTAVATPVWFVEEAGRLLVQTGAASGKVKRIRANPMVKVALCSGRGRLRSPQVEARADVLDASEVARVEQLVRRKYRADMLMIGPLRWAQRTFHLGKERGPSAILALTPELGA